MLLREGFFGPEHMAMPLYCRPGREREAYDTVADIDDWNYYVAELIRVPAEMVYASQIRVLRWKAADLFDPSFMPADAPRRLMYKNVDIQLRYSHVEKVDDTTLDMTSATLISSLCEDGVQRPALDLDFPARLWRDGGRFWLWMDPRSPALDYHGPDMLFEADRAMSAMGLHRSSCRPDRMVACDAVGQAAAALGPFWTGSFEGLVATARALNPLAGAQPVPEGGVWYAVEGDAVVVPSTSWFHFYSDHAVSTRDYLLAVHAAAGCGVLNPGFANGMQDRGFTSLRSPGLLKVTCSEPMEADKVPF